MSSTTRHVATGPAAVALKATGIAWFVAALVGLWLFTIYIAGLYGGAALQDDFARWTNVTIKGYVAGDSAGNIMFGSHVLMAAVLSFGGILQLIPGIRSRAPAFHRWNGRIFIACAVLSSIGGLYLVWVRQATTSFVGSLGITLNAILIIGFAFRAITLARAGNIVAHRDWALRTFMVVNGVWFFRVGLMAWIMINQGPRWVGENMDGPFAMVWAFANYLLPLALLELYFFGRDKAGNKGKWSVTATLAMFSLLMVVGIVATSLFMWLPALR